MSNPEDILQNMYEHLLAKEENNQDPTPATREALEIIGSALEELILSWRETLAISLSTGEPDE